MREWQVACSLQFITRKRKGRASPGPMMCGILCFPFTRDHGLNQRTYIFRILRRGWKSGDRYIAVSRLRCHSLLVV